MGVSTIRQQPEKTMTRSMSYVYTCRLLLHPPPLIPKNIFFVQLVDLGEKYFVKEPELWRSSQLLYSSVLMEAVTDHHPDMDDLARLVALKDTLGLSPMDVAACHQQVCVIGLSKKPMCRVVLLVVGGRRRGGGPKFFRFFLRHSLSIVRVFLACRV